MNLHASFADNQMVLHTIASFGDAELSIRLLHRLPRHYVSEHAPELGTDRSSKRFVSLYAVVDGAEVTGCRGRRRHT